MLSEKTDHQDVILDLLEDMSDNLVAGLGQWLEQAYLIQMLKLLDQPSPVRVVVPLSLTLCPISCQATLQ